MGNGSNNGSNSDSSKGLNIGDRVLIGGRTMLRPGFSLAGLEGTLMPTFPNAPAGCATVHLDWHEQGYDEADDLPSFVNVPLEHLEWVSSPNQSLIETPVLKNSDEEVKDGSAKPILGLVRDQQSSPQQLSSEQLSPDDDHEDEPPLNSDDKPRLRLL